MSAGSTMPCSSAQGQINRLKLIKRSVRCALRRTIRTECLTLIDTVRLLDYLRIFYL